MFLKHSVQISSFFAAIVSWSSQRSGLLYSQTIVDMARAHCIWSQAGSFFQQKLVGSVHRAESEVRDVTTKIAVTGLQG